MRRLLLLPLLCSCSAAWKSAPHDRYFQRTPEPAPHARPKGNSTLDWWYAVLHSTVRPLGEVLSPGHYVDLAVGSPRPLDVNAFGQVIDSTWYFNRINRYPLTPEEVARGANRLDGPADGPLEVLGGKLSGATPGLVVRDVDGHTFVVKFDPPAFPGLSSNAEAIATKLLFAAGYNVPENYVQTVQLSRFRLSPEAKTSGEYGREVPLTQARLDQLLTNVNPYPDGSVRTLMSRLIPGDILGPFDYQGVRTDDPNDRVPHQHRRSLRGLGTFNAWINNTDTRASNTLDVFIPTEPDGRGYVKHYLLDFGDSLGAAGVRPKYIGQAYQARVDWAQIAASFFSVGLYYPYWLPIQRAPFRSVGVFEAAVFDPTRWAPTIPNPAFDEADILDVYWAASVIARFTPAQLEAVVNSAGYTEVGAKEWVLRVLSLRQFVILEHAFARVLPLEDPRIENGTILALNDLAVMCNIRSEPARYRYEVRWDRPLGDEPLASGTVDIPRLDLTELANAFFSEKDRHFSPFMTVAWRLAGQDAPTTEVHLRVTRSGLVPVGMTRIPR